MMKVRLITLIAMAIVSACSVSGSNQTQSGGTSGASSAPVVTKSNTTSDVAVTTTSVVSPNGLTGETTIADNFDASAGIEPTWYGPSGRGGTPPVSADQVGAFRIVCLAGQLLADDPVVQPGVPGGAHLHQFFGNTGTNAYSNYASLRTSGGTTCGQASTPLNRSAYWTPAMLDGAGNVVKPDYLQVYYKQVPESAPECQGAPDANHIGHCIDLPNGIRYVTGYNMATGQGGPTSTGWDPYNMYYQCWDSLDGKVKTPTGAQFKTIADVVAAGCPIGAQLVTIGINPSCWDGVNLDAADHRSHMANEIGTYVASIGLRSCPPDHPYVIPSLQIQYHYTIDANFVAGKWHLSSDDMVAQMTGQPVVAGSTLHFDYWEAWSPTVKATWEKYCVNGHLTCAGGDLGNGTDIIRGDFPPGGPPIHQLVSLASLGITSTSGTSTGTTSTGGTTTGGTTTGGTTTGGTTTGGTTTGGTTTGGTTTGGTTTGGTTTGGTTTGGTTTGGTTTITCPGGLVILSTQSCPTTNGGRALGKKK